MITNFTIAMRHGHCNDCWEQRDSHGRITAIYKDCCLLYLMLERQSTGIGAALLQAESVALCATSANLKLLALGHSRMLALLSVWSFGTAMATA